MAEHPTIPMRGSLYRSQVIGKAGGASYVATNLNLYWDNTSMDPSEAVDYNIGIFEVDSNLNAVRDILILSYTGITAATADDLISQSSLNLNESNTTDYVLRLSFETENNMSYISYSAHYNANDPGVVSEAANLAAFGTSDVDKVTNSDLGDLSSKSGYDSYTELAGTETNVKFRPSLSNPLWMFLNVS
jgi:hypothetical protein